MSETKKRKYEMAECHYITDEKKEIKLQSIRDKNENEVKEPIIIKNPEELEKEGYIVIQAETTIERDGR